MFSTRACVNLYAGGLLIRDLEGCSTGRFRTRIPLSLPLTDMSYVICIGGDDFFGIILQLYEVSLTRSRLSSVVQRDNKR